MFKKEVPLNKFEEEIKNHKKANEASIGPKLIEYSKTEENGILLMENLRPEYITLNDLNDIAKDGKLPIEYKKLDVIFIENLFFEIIKMLKNSFLHMDLNFGNIMVNKEGEIKLIDFGEIQHFENNPLDNIDKKYTPIPYLGKRKDEQLSINELIQESFIAFGTDLIESQIFEKKTQKQLIEYIDTKNILATLQNLMNIKL